PGTVFWLYLVLTGITRFVVEFWRINPVLSLGLSEAQWFSMIMMAVGVWQLFKPGKEVKSSAAKKPSVSYRYDSPAKIFLKSRFQRRQIISGYRRHTSQSTKEEMDAKHSIMVD